MRLFICLLLHQTAMPVPAIIWRLLYTLFAIYIRYTMSLIVLQFLDHQRYCINRLAD